MNPFIILIHAHDYVWNSRSLDWPSRFGATTILWNKAIEVSKEKMLGNSVACTFTDRSGYECGREAVLQLVGAGDEARCSVHREKASQS